MTLGEYVLFLLGVVAFTIAWSALRIDFGMKIWAAFLIFCIWLAL